MDHDARPLTDRLPHLTAFDGILGGGILIHASRPLPDATVDAMRACIEDMERTLSRFREDSLVTRMARATAGGTFTFPDWTLPLFAWIDELARLTDGRLDPCVGADLVRLGYGPAYDLGGNADSHRISWQADVHRDGTTLTTTRAVALDFGSCAKGYCVDLLMELLPPETDVVIDAGGDLRARLSDAPMSVALEDPHDFTQAIGVTRLQDGALCASAPSRRSWIDQAGRRAHHLLDAATGQPVQDVAATWVKVPAAVNEYPTMVADGLATALFTTRIGGADCLVLMEDGQAYRAGAFEVFT
ncbi:FAD:protein FMN transferase, partial [Bifidobacterium cuniculi]